MGGIEWSLHLQKPQPPKPRNLLQFFQSEIPRPNPTQHSSTLPAPESFSRHPPGQWSVWNGGKTCGLLLKRYMQTIANLWIHNVWVIWKVKLQTKSRGWPIFRGIVSGSKTDHLAQKVNHFEDVRIFLDAANPTNLHLIHLGRQEISKYKISITPRCQHQKSCAWPSFS